MLLYSAADWKRCVPQPAHSFSSPVLGLLPAGFMCFVRWAKGREPSYITCLGFGGQPVVSGTLCLSALPKSLLSGLESGTLASAAHRFPGQVSSLAQQEEAVTEMMDRLPHPTHRVPILLLLSLLQSLQTLKIASFCPSLFRDLGPGTSHPDAGLLCFCLSHVLLPCDLISLWKLQSRNRIFVPWEKLTFQD